MRVSHFFINHPIFAAVLSLFVTIVGGVAYFTLPVSQYPPSRRPSCRSRRPTPAPRPRC